MTRKTPDILITNDDGVHAEGLLALKNALSRVGNVHVVAPDRQRSASGHSITLHEPLRVNRARMHDGSPAFSSSGTPSDCVTLSLLELFRKKIDLVVTGINPGQNLGIDVTYSGTVSAAMEAAIIGVPGVAVSVASNGEEPLYEAAAEFAVFLARLVLVKKLPKDTILNVNVPNLPLCKIEGVEITSQGTRRYAGRVERRKDPQGREYFWLGGDVAVDKLEDGTDVKAIAENCISVTPLHLDLTGYEALAKVNTWGIDGFDPSGK